MSDFRSDTVTRPTEEMWSAMREASLDDDTLEGSRTVAELQAEAATITGKDASLFVPSCTMANLIASLTHATRGGEMIADNLAHVIKSEAGGYARLCGLTCAPLPSIRGEMDIGEVARALRPDYSRYGQRTAFILVETSYNHSGGYVPSLEYMGKLKVLAENAGALIHVDGARLFNAATALGQPPAKIAEKADSLSLCLSKGLSAPMGALLIGESKFIERARTFRRMVGGGLRQAGPMAAAGLVALRRMINRLSDDHERARRLWNGIKSIDARLADDAFAGTNIVAMHVHSAASAWEKQLGGEGIEVRASGPNTIRFVTHRHIDDDDVERAIEAIARVAKRISTPMP